jgi:hypothetical protein
MLCPLKCSVVQSVNNSTRSNIFEPIWPTVLLLQPRLSTIELPCPAPATLGRVRAIIKGNVVVPNILEPVDLGRILEQSQCNTVHRRIAPALVEEPSCSIEVVEVVLIRLAAPEIEICDLEIAPKMTCAVAMRLLIVARSCLVVDEPPHRVVLMQVFWMRGEEFQRLKPQCRNALGRVIEVDVEAVRFVVVGHVAEYVVVDIAEELDFGLHAPVVFRICEGRVMVEHAGVPAAHLVVGFEA